MFPFAVDVGPTKRPTSPALAAETTSCAIPYGQNIRRERFGFYNTQ
jgi:hypothetical protein